MVEFTAGGVRAVDVVAPGQSGFIAPGGQASPCLSDRFDLHGNFGNKPLWHSPAEVQRHTRSTTRLNP